MRIPLHILKERLTFISLYIAIYESFKDYLIICPRNLYNSENKIRKDYTDTKEINEIIKEHTEEKEVAKKRLEELKKSGEQVDSQTLERLRIYANFDYIKFTEDEFVQWLVPEYDAKIKERILKGLNKNKPNITLNSAMFFVDNGAISQEDFKIFIRIRDLRNEYVHNMSDVLLFNFDEEDAQRLFDLMVNLYIKINNFWSLEFEASICILDMPPNIDFSNVISTKLYNLLLTIDAMLNSNYIPNIKWEQFVTLYDSLMLPVKEDTTNE